MGKHPVTKHPNTLHVNRIPFSLPPRAPPHPADHAPCDTFDGLPGDASLCLGRIKGGLLCDAPAPIPLKGDPHYPGPTASHRNGDPPEPTLIPFSEGPNDEPIVTLLDHAGHPYNVYIDTGAEADLVPRRLLDLSFPSWRKHRTDSHTKLLAANNTTITHEGRVHISLPLPGVPRRSSASLSINPFVVNSPADATTLILGYHSLKAHGLVPIPGSGLLCTHGPLKQSSGISLGTDIIRQRISLISKDVNGKEFEVWEARPVQPYLVKPHKRSIVTLKPKNVPLPSVNERNGSKVLVRQCPCILSTECEACTSSATRVQMCALMNGTLSFTVDNTANSSSYMLTPKDAFYISFQSIFSLGEVAETALACLPDLDFEIKAPENPYSESECNELFQRTRDEVTKSLRSIAAEPETYSLQGIRPATLRLIDSESKTKPTHREEGDPMPLDLFATVNPCGYCSKSASPFCNLDAPLCELRQFSRRFELPEETNSFITHHEEPFNPLALPASPSLVIGCHRAINNHASTWRTWFPDDNAHPNIHAILQNLYDAAVTEVSKAHLLEAARYAKDHKLQHIHFTNFKSYGVSEKMLLRCIPDHISLHLYHSDQIAVAGPAHDPRRKGVRQTAPCRSTPPPNDHPPQDRPTPPTDGPVPVEPGLPKPIHALRPGGDYSKVSILTKDPNLRARCEAVLRAHDKIFAKSSNDVGQFIDPTSGRPYLFQVRLKGLPPPRHKTRFISPAKEEAATQLVAALLTNGVVKRRFSNYNSQSVYVAKKRKLLSLEEHLQRGNPASSFVEGSIDHQSPLQLRLCIDMTAANRNIVQDNLCSQSPKMMIQRLSGCGSAASLDLALAYHCLTLSDTSQMISGWETGIPSMPARMVFCRAQMGMASSAKWLEVALAKTLSEAHGRYLRYADDIIVVGRDDEDVLENLSCVLDLLVSHGWKIKQEKLTIFAKQLLVFGMKINLQTQQVSIPRADLDAVLLRARPASPAELRSYCGSIAWFAENLGNHAHATALLHRMTRKDGTFTWTEENLQAYETVQEFMSRPAVYTSLPNFDLPFHMVSDSSEHATGCLLLQMAGPDDLRIISYKSHIHDLRTSRLSSHERESYAMIFCVSSFYDIISGRPSTIYSDSQASVLLSLMSRTNSKVARWLCLLRSLPFLQVSWISSKTPILRLCDYLSRRPATSRLWKNKMVDSDDLQRVSLASAKLKRDTIMSLAHHDVLMEYVCHLPNETLEDLADESLYVDQNGNVRSTDTDDNTNMHTQGHEAQTTSEVGSPDPPAHLNHPAFRTRPDTKPISDTSAGASDALQGKPHQVRGPETESGLVLNDEEDEVYLRQVAVTTSDFNPQGLPEYSPPKLPGRPGRVAWGRPATLAQQSVVHSQDQVPPIPHASSVYRIKAHQINNNIEDPLIFPQNLLSEEEADDLGLLDPSPRRQSGPHMATSTSDRPQAPLAHDKEAQFLSMCFDLSPWMRLSDLISSQDSDPKLKLIKDRCKDGPFTKGDATYLVKEGVLLRMHVKDRLENLQICLDRATGYSLCLKAHIGSGKNTYRHSLGPALHHAPKKMISLISSRFYFENMPALCKQIAQCCYICQEGKHSIAVSRTDAHKRMLTPTSPAEAWSLDLLELPCSGGRGGKLLTGMDLFSNFGIAISVDQAPTSEYLFDLIQWQIFACHSRPRFLLCDNASYWRSNAFKEAVTQLNIELRTIPAYSAKSSPVEHLNKLIIKHLRLLHQHHNIPHSSWRRSLPSIINAINFSPYGGPLGQVHKLSPARVFYGDTRQSLDPSARFDLPYLAHRFTSHAAFVKRVADANWAIQQVMAEHRDALQRARLKNKEEHNQRFDSIRSYRMGDVVLFDRKLPEGVASKLRPRAPYRFVVLGETDTCVYVRPWSSSCIEKWLSAQKVSKQSKEAVTLLPLIKLPKERTRRDRTLHLFSSHSRIAEHHLLKDMCLPDPEPFQVEVEEYGPTDDWLAPTPSTYPSENNEQIHDTIEIEEQRITDDTPDEAEAEAPNEPLPDTTLASQPREGAQRTPIAPPPHRPTHRPKPRRGLLRKPGLRRSKRLQKTCRISSTVSFDDGSTGPLHTGPSTCFRIFKNHHDTTNPMEDLDREFFGATIDTPAGLTQIPPAALYDRKCACPSCGKQLPLCRTTPCGICSPL